ncbi:MAG: DUF3501 family protein [Gammaproteobacteria bacterium]|jgi:hypothetical protein|nr:DUF3501 family protein [Gammaproteobacteria bacterium]MDG2339475.1 DUF3501 family protein [Gammaproteobacteria bacterium]
MKKISISDLMSIATYNEQRPAIRQAMMEHKKTRRLPLGPNTMLHFEDYMVMRYQVLELIRAEKISGEEELLEELGAYNPLIPDGKNLKATFMLEYPDEAERKIRLGQLIGIEELISIQIEGFDPVYPIANEDLPRSTDEKTSAVHFLRFEFTDEMIAAAKQGASWTLRSEHQNYLYSSDSIPDEIRNSLIRDFD